MYRLKEYNPGMAAPAVTILITAYREPTTIGRAIEAIQPQIGDPSAEIIVICPDDETAQAASAYQGVTVLCDAGQGKPAALNLGIEKATGQIIVMTDGDVFIGPDALAGGVTTVLAMPNTSPPITNRDTLSDVLARAAAHAVCDYGFYVGGTPDNAEEAAGLSEAIGLKLYVGSSTGSLLVDQLPAQIDHFTYYPKDRIIAVHAEDEAAVQYYAALGQRRPPICAALATAHVLALAEQIGRRLHICHVSTGYELALLRAARARGLDVTCEVSPHHLFLSIADERHLGALGQVNPPLRAQEEVDVLWAQRDVIDMIATDHAPHTLDEKKSASPPSGMPGLETMLPLLLDAAHNGRLSLSDIVRWTATRPAEIFGLADKGQISPGYHADLTLVDLDEEWTIRNKGLLTRCGWTPFADQIVHGYIKQVYLRGKQVVATGHILAKPGDGRPVAQTSVQFQH